MRFNARKYGKIKRFPFNLGKTLVVLYKEMIY